MENLNNFRPVKKIDKTTTKETIMRRTVINSVLTLSFLVFSTALFAIDKKELKEELFRVDETALLQENNEINITVTVSYTHLTLPTKRIV